MCFLRECYFQHGSSRSQIRNDWDRGATGLYHHTGKSIAQIVNESSGKHDVQVEVKYTAGSVFNVNAVMVGDLEFGIVQSD